MCAKFNPSSKEEVEYEAKFSDEFNKLPECVMRIPNKKEALKEYLDRMLYEIQHEIDTSYDDKIYKIAVILMKLDLAINKCTDRVDSKDEPIMAVHSALTKCRDIEMMYFYRFKYFTQYTSFMHTMSLALRSTIAITNDVRLNYRNSTKMMKRITQMIDIWNNIDDCKSKDELLMHANAILRCIKGLYHLTDDIIDYQLYVVKELVTISIYILSGRLNNVSYFDNRKVVPNENRRRES